MSLYAMSTYKVAQVADSSVGTGAPVAVDWMRVGASSDLSFDSFLTCTYKCNEIKSMCILHELKSACKSAL